MFFIVPSILFLAVGSLLVRRTCGIWQKVGILAAFPLGALLGGYLSCEGCHRILRLQGRGEAHNDMMPVAASVVLGLLVGGVALPLFVRIGGKTSKRPNDGSATEAGVRPSACLHQRPGSADFFLSAWEHS